MNSDPKKEIWIFLSHSNEDYDKVRMVRNMLEEQNLRPIMFFLKCLNDDDEIDELIKREIDCRTRFILCDSENARNSKWVQREIEYIKSQQKPYEVIDLSKSIDDILNDISDFKKKTSLFFCYSRNDINIVHYVYNRINKYDFNTFLDINDLTGGDNFAEEIKLALDNAIAKGYILFFVTEASLRSGWCQAEIEYAKRKGAKKQIIPFVLTEEIPDFLQSDPLVIPCKVNNNDSDSITDSIISRLLTPGEILTYANNFENGIIKDLEEAERLKQIYFHLAEEANDKNIPTGIRAFGRCYELGIGTSVDLGKAYEIYKDSFSSDGLCVEDANRVYSMLHPTERETQSKTFWTNILSKLKK